MINFDRDQSQKKLQQGYHLRNIQFLRGVAALGVVLLHAKGIMESNKPSYVPDMLLGAAGVDIFFVLSGFLMIYSSDKLFGKEGSAYQFLKNRAIRIVPLYWILSFLFFLYIIFFEGSRGNTALLAKELLRSAFFIEAASHEYPIIPVGWTLNYEVIFYCIFSIFVGYSRIVTLIYVTLIFILAILIDPILPDRLTTFGTPIVLEFVCGMFICQMFIAGWRLNNVIALLVVVAAFILLVLMPPPDENWWWRHGLEWGPSAVAIVFAIALARNIYITPIANKLVAIGDFSYSLYLTHWLFFTFVDYYMRNIEINNKAVSTTYFISLVLVSLCIGLLCHSFVDMPVYRFLKRARVH